MEREWQRTRPRRGRSVASSWLPLAGVLLTMAASALSQVPGVTGPDASEPAKRVDTTLVGRVLGADGSPRAGARIRYVPSSAGRQVPEPLDLDDPHSWSRLAATTSDRDGRFRLVAGDVRSTGASSDWQPRVGWYSYHAGPVLVVDHHEHATLGVPLTGVAGGIVSVGDVHLEPGALLRLRVLDRSGHDVDDGVVRISQRPDPLGLRSRASDFVLQRSHIVALDGHGTLVLPGIPLGALTLSVEALGYRPFQRDLDVDAPGALRLDDVTLELGRVFTGRVLDTRGTPVESAEVMAGPSQREPTRGIADTPRVSPSAWRYAGWTWARATTDAWGGFVLRGLPPSEWMTLLVDHEGHEPEAVTGEHTGGTPIEVTLPDPASWLLTVVDTQGRAVAGAVGRARRREHPWDDRDGMDDELLVLAGEQAAVAAGRTPGAPGLLLLPVAGRARTDVTVSAPGHLSQVVELPGLAPPTRDERTVVLEPAPRVTVHLVDARGAPLAAAAVTAWMADSSGVRPPVPVSHLTATTDAGGLVTLELPLRGEWLLRADHPATVSDTHPFAIPDDRLALDLGEWRLAVGGTARGVLYDAHGRPLRGEPVQAEPADPDPWTLALPIPSEPPPRPLLPTTRTDPQGRFELRGLRPGAWRLLGPGGAREMLTVSPDEPTWCVLEEPGPTRALGRVLDGDQPVAGAEIRGLFVRSGPVLTDEQGRFACVPDAGFIESCHGLLPVQATVDDASTPLVWLSVERGCDHWVELAFQHGELGGVVRDARSGRPLAGVAVSARREAAPSARPDPLHGRSHVVTDGDGRFRLTRLAAGRWSLWSGARGYVAWQADPILVGPDQRIDTIAIALRPAADLRGSVLLPDGTTIPEATEVRLLDEDGRVVVEDAMYATDGSFTALGVPPGHYQVVIAPDRWNDDALRWVHVYARAEVDLLEGEERAINLVAEPWPGWPLR